MSYILHVFHRCVVPNSIMLSPIGILQPKIVEALLGYEVVRVSCGPNHIMAVTNDNEVFAWGKTDSGW